MKEAADKNGKLLMIGFVRRFGNDCAIMKDFIDNGYFGDIYEAGSAFDIALHVFVVAVEPGGKEIVHSFKLH